MQTTSNTGKRSSAHLRTVDSGAHATRKTSSVSRICVVVNSSTSSRLKPSKSEISCLLLGTLEDDSACTTRIAYVTCLGCLGHFSIRLRPNFSQQHASLGTADASYRVAAGRRAMGLARKSERKGIAEDVVLLHALATDVA